MRHLQRCGRLKHLSNARRLDESGRSQRAFKSYSKLWRWHIGSNVSCCSMVCSLCAVSASQIAGGNEKRLLAHDWRLTNSINLYAMRIKPVIKFVTLWRWIWPHQMGSPCRRRIFLLYISEIILKAHDEEFIYVINDLWRLIMKRAQRKPKPMISRVHYSPNLITLNLFIVNSVSASWCEYQ